jgi:chromosome segregation ATPase
VRELGRWRICALGVVVGVLLCGAPLSALPPKAERIQEVRNLVAALQNDLQSLVLDLFEGLALSLRELEEHLELLAEGAQDLAEQGGVYRPDEVRILLLQTEEIFNSLLFFLKQALHMIDSLDDGLDDLQGELDDLKDEKLLSASAHKRATRALTQAQQILWGKLHPPLSDLRNLSDDGTDEDCVTVPFGEPNMDADVHDCLEAAKESLNDGDYEALVDHVQAAVSKLDPLWERLTQVFRGASWRRGPVPELLTQLKRIDRELVAALKRQLRRPRPLSASLLPAQGLSGKLTLFDLQGRPLAALPCHAAPQACLQALPMPLAPGVYIAVLTEQTPQGQLRRSLHKIILR